VLHFSRVNLSGFRCSSCRSQNLFDHQRHQDLTTSTRFPSNPWSYEACATPPLGSYQCPNNIVAPSLVAHPFLPPATVVISSPSDHTSDHLLTPTSTSNNPMVQAANPDHPILHIANSGHVSSDSSSGAIINLDQPRSKPRRNWRGFRSKRGPHRHRSQL